MFDFDRERGRYFDDAIQKIDKLYPPPRKRSRGDTLSSDQSNILVSGGTIPKSGPQSHLNANGLELGVSKVEERTKNAIQNRKFRSPILETQVLILHPSLCAFCLYFSDCGLWHPL